MCKSLNIFKSHTWVHTYTKILHFVNINLLKLIFFFTRTPRYHNSSKSKDQRNRYMSFRSTRLSIMTWTAQILLIIPTWRTQIWSRLCQIRTVRMKVPHQRPTTIWIVIPSPLCTRVVWNIFYQHTVYIVASSATKLILNGVF